MRKVVPVFNFLQQLNRMKLGIKIKSTRHYCTRNVVLMATNMRNNNYITNRGIKIYVAANRREGKKQCKLNEQWSVATSSVFFSKCASSKLAQLQHTFHSYKR